MTIEPNPLVLAESAFDDGKEEMKHQVNEVLNTFINGPYDDKSRDMLYNIREEIKRL